MIFCIVLINKAHCLLTTFVIYQVMSFGAYVYKVHMYIKSA